MGNARRRGRRVHAPVTPRAAIRTRPPVSGLQTDPGAMTTIGSVHLLAALWSALASAQAPQDHRRASRASVFDDSFDAYVVFGALNVPVAGKQTIDYGASFDPGYQWGVGLGYLLRAHGTPFAASGGLFFDHALINPENGSDLGFAGTDQVVRVGAELRAGLVLGERVFAYVPLRGGYAGNVVQVNEHDTDMSHGLVFGVGAGVDVAVYRRLYVGTVVGADLHYFRTGHNVDLHTFAWRTHVGLRF